MDDSSHRFKEATWGQSREKKRAALPKDRERRPFGKPRCPINFEKTTGTRG